ncbi:unnamed protein product [Durusdinium trenchii]|uniref:Uncharacterized protein n=2 Tax=Durusdinium trenchii TaxID=1381693 RepID=A0ABP0MZX9_9DINO
MGKDLDEALPDDDEGDDYDRDEDFDGDYQGDEAFELKGSEDLAMEYDVFGKYVKSAQVENGKPVFLGPKTEGSRPSIAFTDTTGDGKPTWWVCNASGGECFYAESDTDVPPRTGWRTEYGGELEVVLEACQASDEKKECRSRSRSPRGKCPW